MSSLVEASLRSAAVPLLSGPFLAISILLVVAGVMKLRRPAFTAGALRALHLPAGESLVRLLGLAEIVVGSGAVVTGARPWAVAVGSFYIGFGIFVLLALRSDAPIATCGCFGSPDTPPSVGHVVLNSVSAGVALLAAIRPPGPWLGLGGIDPGSMIAFLLFSSAAVYLLYGIVNVLPQQRKANREVFVRLTPSAGTVDE